MIFPYRLSGYNANAISCNKAHEITLCTCSSGENPKDHTLLTIAMSFENVRIGILFFFANGLIFNNTSLVNGPMINLGLSTLKNLI